MDGTIYGQAPCRSRGASAVNQSDRPSTWNIHLLAPAGLLPSYHSVSVLVESLPASLSPSIQLPPRSMDPRKLSTRKATQPSCLLPSLSGFPAGSRPWPALWDLASFSQLPTSSHPMPGTPPGSPLAVLRLPRVLPLTSWKERTSSIPLPVPWEERSGRASTPQSPRKENFLSRFPTFNTSQILAAMQAWQHLGWGVTSNTTDSGGALLLKADDFCFSAWLGFFPEPSLGLL